MGLQNVLMALGGPRKGGGVPYRDSKLTRYLQVTRFTFLLVSFFTNIVYTGIHDVGDNILG